MNRIVTYLGLSIFILVFSALTLLYIRWDVTQPKTGPEGNGRHFPPFYQVAPLWGGLLTGTINTPIAIYRYIQHKKQKREETL